MFNLFAKWKEEWDKVSLSNPGKLVPERNNDEVIPYPYPVKKVVVSGNIEIAYVDEGNASLETILFIHGMASGIPVWRKNIRDLKRHYRCIAVDLPGHGYSGKGNYPYTVSFFAGVILSFIERLGLQSLCLAGHSMGAQIACVAALRAPILIKQIILASPSGFERYTASDKQTLINLAVATVGMGHAFTQHKLNFMMGFRNHNEEAGELAARLPIYKQDAPQFGKMMLKCIESMLLEGLSDVLSSIKQPSLILVGSDDIVSPYQFIHGERYEKTVRVNSANIPYCKFVRIEDCGHFVQYQRPKLFNKEVVMFLNTTQVINKI
jgi:pimeloyl-ACP methyl ester carboxylesterase